MAIKDQVSFNIFLDIHYIKSPQLSCTLELKELCFIGISGLTSTLRQKMHG